MFASRIAQSTSLVALALLCGCENTADKQRQADQAQVEADQTRAAAESEALCRGVFGSVVVLGLHHARLLHAHELALAIGWDRVHRGLRITDAFYRRFTPAISTRDFALRSSQLERALDFLAILRL